MTAIFTLWYIFQMKEKDEGDEMVFPYDLQFVLKKREGMKDEGKG